MISSCILVFMVDVFVFQSKEGVVEMEEEDDSSSMKKMLHSIDNEDKPNSHRASRLKGMRIRDEFICPITYELMREPMVASDGHTYERNAIEKWLKCNKTSPLYGTPMEPLIFPNINLKKLIQDIIHEVNK